MNRELRRRCDKAKVPESIRNELLLEGQTQAVKIFDLTIGMVARDKLGFGKSRINQLLFDINEQFDCILKNYVSVDDYRAELLKIGVDVGE